ncbi:type II CRISPR RNA-guided endonuclease Cas9 [Dysgonomonas sp. ZJ279]|uniref:type II CRISPR RNA-guided endonuclease Cas9 n=1 Tax=Dysgonomonas sp. ZJ279 TaxID=2709796 RepID=UPI0013EA592D|nr:type II CRISPR RNA-guided endonuclease Cas9 [Dysgonomonas sp. ZJ279]
MKKILGLDLGTNSIGWALVDAENKKIEGMGSRIIPMGTDKQDYEKGVGVTKNATRREKRTARKMNKRYKLRRNKLLYVLYELGMLPTQFQFKNDIPEANKIQELELLPIKKGTMQLDSLGYYQLKVNSLRKPVDDIKDLGKILYQFNQLRGYSGGDNEDDSKKKTEDDSEDGEKKAYEVFTRQVEILSVEKSDRTFKIKGGKNKGEEQFYFDVIISLNDEEIQGSTMLQNLKEKEGKEEELEIRIRRTKKGVSSVIVALPQKTNWRKQMEATEAALKRDGGFISELLLRDLEKNKWAKIRNRVTLRNRYEEEFDAIWDIQSKKYSILDNCPKEKLNNIAWYLFPGERETQKQLRKEAIEGGLKYIIKNQIIYYQRPLKSQEELIGKCRFEKEEKVIANSHPLFQEFRCWDQINKLYITSKCENFSETKRKNVFEYTDRFLNQEEKLQIYSKLQYQKQISFGEIAKIVKLKSDGTEYLNGLNAKAKLKGCDTSIAIKKTLGVYYENIVEKDNEIVEKIWQAIFYNSNYGSEYDPKSPKVSSITDLLKKYLVPHISIELALNIAQNIKFPRKYANLSDKAIRNILPLMQLNPMDVSDNVKDKFNNIQHLIETAEILDENLLENSEEYVISFIKNHPDLLNKGGIMYAFASSLVYGKHTKETIKAQILDYHDIKYVDRKLRNPIVEQIINETMQVVKAIWKEYKFDPKELEIRVELARDLKNSSAERENIYKGQINNQKNNEAVKKRLAELKQEPTQGNIELYKLWEGQKYTSPYTKEPIPLSKLFSPERLYDIDHIIPKSRFFDDSISNKIVCESDINEEKSNRTAWEYMSQQNSKFKICSIEEYINFVNDNFHGRKKRNLLLEKIPTGVVDRQIKDTQYISLAVKDELAKIVGSDNIKTSTGEVTSFLRSRWGLKDLFMKLTESRFKQMELWDWNNETNRPNEEWIIKYYDQEKEKHIYQIKNWSKRYDHRHHSIDALVVALTEPKHIQRLNNLNKYLQDELLNKKDEFKIGVQEGETILEAFFNLEEKRRIEIQRSIESSRYLESLISKPSLLKQAQEYLEKMVISHKPKDKLGIKIVDDKTGSRQLKIRAALHQETYYGKTLGRDTKTVAISSLKVKDISQIIDEVIKTEIDCHRKKYETMKEAFTGEGLIAFNESRFQTKKNTELKPPVYKVKLWYSGKEESSLQRLYDNNTKKSVVTGDNYLFVVMESDV